MFTQQELQNLLILINKATLTGAEALTVAQLQVKINGLLKEAELPPKAVGKTSTEETTEDLEDGDK